MENNEVKLYISMNIDRIWHFVMLFTGGGDPVDSSK